MNIDFTDEERYTTWFLVDRVRFDDDIILMSCGLLRCILPRRYYVTAFHNDGLRVDYNELL